MRPIIQICRGNVKGVLNIEAWITPNIRKEGPSRFIFLSVRPVFVNCAAFRGFESKTFEFGCLFRALVTARKLFIGYRREVDLLDTACIKDKKKWGEGSNATR